MTIDAMIFIFWMLSFKQLFHSPLSLSSRGSSLLHFLPYGWCHLHIWGYWYFSLQSWFQLCFIPWRRKSQPTPVLLPEESCGQRSLVGYSPRVTQSRTRLKRFSMHCFIQSWILHDVICITGWDILPWRTPFPIETCPLFLLWFWF